MKKIGITGNIGTGKSSVKRILIELKKDVIDVDEMNAKLLEKGASGYEQLVLRFGSEILDENQRIDKTKMASMIFSNLKIKQEVESILHPLLKKQVSEYIQEASGDVFVEVPLLFEVSWEDMFDEIWLVCTSKQTVLERLQTYRHMSFDDALARYESQMPQDEKILLSDVVLDNNGTYEELYTQVVNALKEG